MLWGFLVQTCPTPHSAVGMYRVGRDPRRLGCKTCWDLVLSGPSGGSHNPAFTGGTPCCGMPLIPMFTWVEKFILGEVGKEIYGDPDAFASPQGYMKPLKQPENSLLCDPSLVDEIFDQIPELLEHHEQFLEQIHDCVQNWHEKQKVGDLLVQSVGPRGVDFHPGNPGVPALGHGPSRRSFGAGGKGVIKGQAKHA